jgi:hypothetical protein
MPVEIWDSAVVLARVYGACRIARAVDLDYKSLRLRMARAMEKPGLVKPIFVELPATVVPENPPYLHQAFLEKISGLSQADKEKLIRNLTKNDR